MHLNHRRSRLRDTEFADYVATRQTALLRTAYLLTGDGRAAADAARVSFARVYVANRRGRAADMDLLLLQALIRATHRRRWWSGPATGCPGLWERVQRLPHRQRVVVVLYHYEELGDARIAEILDLPVGTVRRLAARAERALFVSTGSRRTAKLTHETPAAHADTEARRAEGRVHQADESLDQGKPSTEPSARASG